MLQRAAETGFEVFLTADQNLQYQQNLAQSRLAVIVLVAPSNTLEDLMPLVPFVLKAIGDVRSGEVRRIGPR